jgi:hypothetical protein
MAFWLVSSLLLNKWILPDGFYCRTDMSSDVDDVGALAILNELTNLGEARAGGGDEQWGEGEGDRLVREGDQYVLP